MNGEARRERILHMLQKNKEPIAGTKFAKEFDVSRQVIVQDIALLRANGSDIISTNRGYILKESDSFRRVFKVFHAEDQVEEELSLIVDLGGKIEDVFVYHKIYGVLKAPMNIRSRMDIKNYMNDLSTGKSTLLMNVTSGYHYHTVTADSELLLDIIMEQLNKKGFLAKLQDYEPVNFWKEDGED